LDGSGEIVRDPAYSAGSSQIFDSALSPAVAVVLVVSREIDSIPQDGETDPDRVTIDFDDLQSVLYEAPNLASSNRFASNPIAVVVDKYSGDLCKVQIADMVASRAHSSALLLRCVGNLVILSAERSKERPRRRPGQAIPLEEIELTVQINQPINLLSRR
jgi:hypothetical protein